MALVVDALPGHNHFEGDGYRAKGSCMQTDSRHAALQQYLRALALYRYAQPFHRSSMALFLLVLHSNVVRVSCCSALLAAFLMPSLAVTSALTSAAPLMGSNASSETHKTPSSKLMNGVDAALHVRLQVTHVQLGAGRGSAGAGSQLH